MPRRTRDDFPGAWHHVFHRGARKAPIFKLQTDCYRFLEVLGETVKRFSVEIHAYSLMPNHYHLLIRSPLGNLSKAMQYLNGSYTLWLNKKHKWDGPVFRGRFGSELVTGDEYLKTVFTYIHLNPLVAHLVPRLTSESWTSLRAYLDMEPVPAWLTTEIFLEWFGGAKVMKQYLSEIHTGARSYPEDFDRERGRFRKRLVEEKASNSIAPSLEKAPQGTSQATGLMRMLPEEEVLQIVCQICGVRRNELNKNISGPRANPPRRFAIWALDRSSRLSQREIGHLLDVSYSQVTSLLTRMRKRTREPIASWVEEWLVLEDSST